MKDVKHPAIRGTVESADGSHLCLFHREGRIEVWNHSSDRKVTVEDGADSISILATLDACVVHEKGRVRMIFFDGRPTRTIFEGEATSVEVGDKQVFLVHTSGLIIFSETGEQIERYDAEPNLQRAFVMATWLVRGYRDGSVEVAPRTPRSMDTDARWILRDTPTSRVTRLAAGPEGTLLVGFSTGMVGLWNVATGERLHTAHLHGSVTHLAYRGLEAYAASELGEYEALDLAVLTEDRCTVLEEMWADVPVVWKLGRAVSEPLPRKHLCLLTQD